MKSTAIWEGGFRTTITNSDGHAVTVDLPESMGGKGEGMTALELNAASFGGCFNTIFALLAGKMRLTFSALSTEITAEHPQGEKTITESHVKVSIKTSDDEQKIRNCIEKTLETCPVGNLYRAAGVKLTLEVIFEK